MSKINTNKMNDFEQLRGAARSGDAKAAGKTDAGSLSVENKASVSEDKLQFSSQAADAGKLFRRRFEPPVGFPLFSHQFCNTLYQIVHFFTGER